MMQDTRVEIVGRVMDSTRVLGYVMETMDKKRYVYNKEQTYRLALEKGIKNCVAEKYSGEARLRGTTVRLVDLPEFDRTGNIINNKDADKNKGIKRYSIVKRVMQGKTTIMYKVLSPNGVLDYMSKEELLEIARAGQVNDVRVQMCNGKPLLRSMTGELNKIEVEYMR